MRYLVTGGFGYVGSWVTRHLAGLGHEVFVLSRGSARQQLGVPYTLCSADLTGDSRSLAETLPDAIDACIHTASFNEVDTPDYGRLALLHNALGTRTLLEAFTRKRDATGHAAPVCVYLSTFHVYGRGTGHISEATPPEPRNEYALSHLMAEEYCRYFHRCHELPAIVARLSNCYGAPCTVPFTKWYLLLNDLCRTAYTTGNISLRSSPATRRDFVWLGDVAHCLTRLSQDRGLAGSSFTLASGWTPSIGELARLVADVYRTRYAKELGCSFPPAPQTEAEGHTQPALRIDSTALTAALGGYTFQNRMAHEIDATFAYLEQHVV